MILKQYHPNPLGMTYILFGAMLERAIKAKAAPVGLTFFEQRAADFWTR